jgi:hypothetical protein
MKVNLIKSAITFSWTRFSMARIFISTTTTAPTTSPPARRCHFDAVAKLWAVVVILSSQAVWPQSRLATIAGIVVDAATGETLPFANVLLLPDQRGTTTDAYGRFLLSNLPARVFYLRVSYLGFEMFQDSVRVDSGQTQQLRIALQPKALAIPEVVVTAERDRLTREVNLSQEYLDNQQIRTTSSVAEPDLLRSLAILPGVIQTNDYNSRFYVRGGQGNENQVMVDGVTIHNPFHALGLFSTFNVEAIKAVEFYRGIFPARYSERLSSVTNVIMRDGNARRFSGLGMLSLVTSKFLFEGPILKYQPQTGRKWTYMINGRRTYFDAIADFPLSFYDVSAKSVYDSGNKTKLLLHGFSSHDRINEVSDTYPNIHWNNRVAGFDWQQFLSPRSFFKIQLAYSDFRSDANNPQRLQEEGESFLRQKNSIRELSLQGEWNKHLKNTIVTAGYGFSRFNIDQYLNSFFQEVFQGRWREHDQHKAYLTFEGSFGERWLYEAGVSWFHFRSGYATKFLPRLGMKYLLNEGWRLKGGLGRHYQILTTINDDDDPLVLFDAWLPSPPNRPVPRADHYGLGVEFSQSSSLEADLEFYYRRYAGLTRFNRSQRAGEPFYLDGWAESYGMEMRFHYGFKTFYGFANYAHGHAIAHFFLRNQPMRFENDFRWQTFPSAGDVRHTLNAVVGFHRGGNWNISLSGIFQTGRPYTAYLGETPAAYDFPLGTWPPFNQPILGNSYFASEPIYSSKNRLRLPFYQRVDLHVARNIRWLGMEGSFFVQIYNLFFRQNSAFYIPGDRKVQKGLPILPTFGLAFRF